MDPTYLSKKSLGEIGYVLEVSLHNNMHMRWASDNPPVGFKNRPEITAESLKGGLKLYDDPKYNWLADPYSAHVNKVFWKLHGLVESVVFHWLSANQKTSIEENCGAKSDCYTWRGTWLGASPHPAAKGSDHNHSDAPQLGTPKAMQPHAAPGSFEDAFSKAVED